MSVFDKLSYHSIPNATVCAGTEPMKTRQLERELTAANERIKRLEEALDMASNMWTDWVENRHEDGCSGAYYAFVKRHHDEWDVIMKAKESK